MTSNPVTESAMLTDTEWAYLAGLIDGEGTIGIYKHYDPRRKTDGMYYQLNFRLANSNKEVIDWIISKLGGNLVVYQPRYKQSLKSYVWSAIRKDLQLTVLKGVLPYLIIKKRQAEIGIKFLEVSEYRKWEGRNAERTRLTLIKYEFFEELYKRSRLLNSRGHSEKISGEFGGIPNVKSREIPSQASKGKGFEEGVTTTEVSPNNNPIQAPSPAKNKYLGG